MNLFHRMERVIASALADAYPNADAAALARVTVEPTRDPSHGDLATNAALVLAKALGQAPKMIAAALADRLAQDEAVAKAEPAGPGFVNVTLREAFLRERLRDVLEAGDAYGDGAPSGRSVNVEYVSANPTGPLHVGHCRGAVVGDALANLLAKAGHLVVKEFYVNDAGAQVDALAWATYWRYLQALGADLPAEAFDAQVPGGLQYRGDYLVEVGERLAATHGASLAGPGATSLAPDAWIEVVRGIAVAAMLEGIREDLAVLGVAQDRFSSERALVEAGAVAETLQALEERGLIYTGVLEPPKGKTPDDWEPRPQTLFASSRFGDDTDRPLRKSDGSFTYFANDIAYHRDKLERRFDRLIVILGADHGGYVKRMKAAVSALSEGRVGYEAVLCQIVRVVKGGEPVRMSKRAGTFVTLRDLIDEVGADVVRFHMLTRKADAQMEFDLDLVTAQSRDNPVFYVQYAHARCRSVLRHASVTFGADALAPAALAQVTLDGLADPHEFALLRRLVQWPRLVESAAEAAEPHRIAFALQEIAAAFHALWNRGKDQEELRFILASDKPRTMARLALVEATATVIRSGLKVMGVAPVEEMGASHAGDG